MDTTHCHPFSRDTIGSDKGYFWVLSPCFTRHQLLLAQTWVSGSSSAIVSTNITMNIIKIEEKDTFHNVIGYKQKPSVSFLVRILVENFVTQK